MSMIGTWWAGLLRVRGGRLAATAAGIATAVALLCSLGQFLASAQATMTARAVRSVVVDWQVEVQPGANLNSVLSTVRGTPGVQTTAVTGFAATTGLSATAQGTAQTTGAGQVLGLPPDYRQRFPGQLRTLAGSDSGVLIAQQTAANLRVRAGDTVEVGLAGLAPVRLRVDGVVDLPQADSLFQKVGAPAGSQPTAPPDNVLILPLDRWHQVTDALAAARPDQVRSQVHVSLRHALPSAPASAYTQVVGAAHNVESRSAGAARVGDNLGAALDAARSDAAYARITFLFLGLPGAVLAALLTVAVAGAGAGRRRAEQALLRSRGATARRAFTLTGIEALTTAVPGCVVGVGVAALVGVIAFGSARFGASVGEAVVWTVSATAVGLVIAVLSVVVPAVADWRRATVAASRAAVGRRTRRPLWLRFGLDVALLAVAGLVFWAASASHYELVLAPEGVPSISVSYWVFAAPALLWLGGALLVWRVGELTLGLGKRFVRTLLRPVAGRLAATVAASLARRRRLLTRSIVLLALTVSFAASTAVFNATYRAQAEVDAKLSNGADVTVTESPGAHVGPAAGERLRSVPGVRSVEPLQHRFAYVGADLQDCYGVRPDTIGSATALQDSYFQGGTAAEMMRRLAVRSDAILVSAETVADFQLRLGDQVRLRLPDARTGQLVTVPFHYAGIVAEFPTAPKDSFLVANAAYLSQRTGSDAVGSFLVDAGGVDTAAVAQRLRDVLGPSVPVTDLSATRASVGSSLTAVDLAGLTRVELIFALVLAAGAAGLVLALGLNERRRDFAIVRALGAGPRDLRAFVTGETCAVVVGGAATGIALGWALTEMLVAILTGVFDPPPDILTVPWVYLLGLAATVLVSLTIALLVVSRLAGRDAVSAFRET